MLSIWWLGSLSYCKYLSSHYWIRTSSIGEDETCFVLLVATWDWARCPFVGDTFSCRQMSLTHLQWSTCLNPLSLHPLQRRIFSIGTCCDSKGYLVAYISRVTPPYTRGIVHKKTCSAKAFHKRSDMVWHQRFTMQTSKLQRIYAPVFIGVKDIQRYHRQ